MKKEPVPLDDRVIIEPLPAATKTDGGIYIPETAQEKPQRGTILYCGSSTLEVKKGNTVFYGRHAGQPINIDNKDCLLMREADILCII